MRKSGGFLVAALTVATLWAPQTLNAQRTVAVAKPSAAAAAVDAQLTALAKLQLKIGRAHV